VRKSLSSLTAVGAVSLAFAGNAGAFIQHSQVKFTSAAGAAKPVGGKNVNLDSYLATRDPDSTRGMKQANPVGSVNMTFPAGSKVNKAAVGAGNVCQQSEYSTPAYLAATCANAEIGTGWALLNDGNPLPAIREQVAGAPPACTDSGQYSRTWEANPAAGPDCIPVGDLFVKVTAYQGGILKSKYWCYGMDSVLKTEAQLSGKKCYFKDAAKKLYNYSGLALNSKYDAGLNGCNIIFANNNALNPLAFGGSTNNCGNVLSVVIPASNGTGSGLGELTAGFVLTDFYLKTNNASYLTAGACPSKSYKVSTKFTYSKFKGDSALPASTPATKTVNYSGTCVKK
jgi:hypothetical protein